MISAGMPVRWARSALAATILTIVLLAGAMSSAWAQSEEDSANARLLTGRVVHDGNPVPHNPVSLHRITPTESGEIASTVSDESGRFAFELLPVPEAAFTVYFATTEYDGVRFLGEPLHADSATAIEYLLPVYDTLSVLPEPIRVSSRYMFMLPNLTGGWEVLEILSVRNPTGFAFVSDPTGAPWGFHIPEGASDFQVGDGDVMPHELSWIDDRVLYLTPLSPGNSQVLVSYRLPSGPARSRLRIEEPTDTMHVFIRQPAHLTSITGMTTTRRLTVEGDEFLQYTGTDLQMGSTVDLQWSRAGGLPIDPIVAAVSITLILLAAGLIAAFRGRGAAV